MTDSRTFKNQYGHEWTEYKLDPVIANRIKELRLGIGGNVHSWRALAGKVIGNEDQMTGKELCRLAQWTLNEDWDE